MYRTPSALQVGHILFQGGSLSFAEDKWVINALPGAAAASQRSSMISSLFWNFIFPSARRVLDRRHQSLRSFAPPTGFQVNTSVFLIKAACFEEKCLLLLLLLNYSNPFPRYITHQIQQLRDTNPTSAQQQARAAVLISFSSFDVNFSSCKQTRRPLLFSGLLSGVSL